MEFIIQQVGYEASLGRWGINLFDSLRNNIAIPFITTLISILLMGLINILLIELFEIKNKIFQVLMMASVIASPSLCMTLLYAYTADAYLFAMFFSVLTVYALYCIKNKKMFAFFFHSLYTIHCARLCAFEIAWESSCTARTTA